MRTFLICRRFLFRVFQPSIVAVRQCHRSLVASAAILARIVPPTFDNDFSLPLWRVVMACGLHQGVCRRIAACNEPVVAWWCREIFDRPFILSNVICTSSRTPHLFHNTAAYCPWSSRV